MAVYGSNVHEYMSDYRAFILESSKKYTWASVSVYDFRHRSRLASMVSLSDRFNFSCKFNDINNSVLDTTAIKPNAPRCNRCKAYDHLISDCPFLEVKSIQAQKQTQNASQEICLNFNRERCISDRCKRKHVCQKCKGNLPYAKCQLSGPCKSNVTASI